MVEAYLSLLGNSENFCWLRSWRVWRSWGSAEIPWALCFLLSRWMLLLIGKPVMFCPKGNTLWNLSRCDRNCWISSSLCCSRTSNWRMWSSLLVNIICNSCMDPIVTGFPDWHELSNFTVEEPTISDCSFCWSKALAVRQLLRHWSQQGSHHYSKNLQKCESDSSCNKVGRPLHVYETDKVELFKVEHTGYK